MTLFVKDLGAKGKSNFSFRLTDYLKEKGLDFERGDMMMNYTKETDQAMDGAKPWRGAREKDPRFFACLIDAVSDEGDLVVDCTAATGISSNSFQCLM